MTRNNIFVFAFTLALAACGPKTTVQTVPLVAQMGSGQSGTATLTDTFLSNGTEYVNVHIDTHGGNDTGSQRATIASGTCASHDSGQISIGTVLGGVEDYAIQFTLAYLGGGHRCIVIYNSDTDKSSDVQCCGDIP